MLQKGSLGWWKTKPQMDRIRGSARSQLSATNSNAIKQRKSRNWSLEAHRFKTGDNLDNPCARLKTHFKKHRLDTIAHRNNPNNVSQMVSVFTSHPLLTVDDIKACNATIIGKCDTHNKQNDSDATEHLMNGLGEDLQQNI